MVDLDHVTLGLEVKQEIIAVFQILSMRFSKKFFTLFPLCFVPWKGFACKSITFLQCL